MVGPTKYHFVTIESGVHTYYRYESDVWFNGAHHLYKWQLWTQLPIRIKYGKSNLRDSGAVNHHLILAEIGVHTY